MTAVIIFIMAILLVGSVILGIVVHHKKRGKPAAGRDADGDPRISS